jgi:hypothetical protein
MTTHGAQIAGLKPGGSIALDRIDYGGSLEARRTSSGRVLFYWRYTEDSRTGRISIGPYDSSAPPKKPKPTAKGYSVVAAKAAASELAKLNSETPGGIRGEIERRSASDEANRVEAEALQRYTLGNLCDQYCDWLEKRGKSSHRDARNIISNHLKKAFPQLAQKPAQAVEKKDIVEVLRSLRAAEKRTTARKLRSYLRSAYSCAMESNSDTDMPAGFEDFGISRNPVDTIRAINPSADKNPLKLGELRTYWKLLKRVPAPIGPALRLHVICGGQRVAQLARLRAPDDIDTRTLRLIELKGKRSEPRIHLLPLTPMIRAELAQLPAKGFILSSDGGETPMHPTSLSAWARDIALNGKLPGFQLKRVRSGIETALGTARISPSDRGQLQSHGISGVQATHYDAYQYLPEKRKALATLGRLLERPSRKAASTVKTSEALG